MDISNCYHMMHLFHRLGLEISEVQQQILAVEADIKIASANILSPNRQLGLPIDYWIREREYLRRKEEVLWDEKQALRRKEDNMFDTMTCTSTSSKSASANDVDCDNHDDWKQGEFFFL